MTSLTAAAHTVLLNLALCIKYSGWKLGDRPGYLSRYSDWAGRPTNRVSIPGKLKRFFSLHIVLSSSGAHQPHYQAGATERFLVTKGVGAKLNTQLHVAPWLRVNGAVSPPPHMRSWLAQAQLFSTTLSGRARERISDFSALIFIIILVICYLNCFA